MCADCCTMTVHLQTWVKALCPLLTPTSPPLLKRKTAPKPKLMTHHRKANFWNCNFGLLWQQGKYSSNGFAQMHLHQRWRWCTTVNHIATMRCNGTQWQSGLLRSKESQSAKRIGLQLSTVCQIAQRPEMALKRNCKNTKEFHFSTSLVQHLQISSCHQFVQSHTRELSWMTPPTSHLPPLCLRESLPFNPPAKALLSSTGCGGAAPNTHESSREPTIPVKSNLGKPRISSAFQGSSFKLLGKFFLCKFSGRIFKDMLQLLVWAWKEGLGWAAQEAKMPSHLMPPHICTC